MACPTAENMTTRTCGKMGALTGKNQNKSGTNQRQIKFVEICIKFVLISVGVAKLMPQNNDRATREKLSKIINKIIIKIYFV